jgi:hypothetical protein
MFRKSTKTGNVLSAIESQGFRKRRTPVPGDLKLMPHPSGNEQQCLNDTSSRKFRFGGKKGQPEGSAVTGKTGKPAKPKIPNKISTAFFSTPNQMRKFLLVKIQGTLPF